MAEDDPDRKSTIAMVMEKAAPWSITATFTFLMFVVGVVFAGTLLQVPVGPIIQQLIDDSRDKTVTSIRQSIDHRVDELSDRIAASQVEMAREITGLGVSIEDIRSALDRLTREVSASTGRIDAIEGRVQGVEDRLGRVERYICDHDSARGFGSCALDTAE